MPSRLSVSVGEPEELKAVLRSAGQFALRPPVSWRGRLRAWRSAARPRGTVKLVLLIAVLFLASRPLVQAFRVEGVSMIPTLQDGQLLLVDKLSYWPVDGLFATSEFAGSVFGGARRGDLVVFHEPASAEPGTPERTLVKRLIGLPGDQIRIDHGTVLVNGKALEEPYVHQEDSSSYPTGGGTLNIPPGDLFVLGDNRPRSSDSRQGWLVPIDHLVGRAWLSYWPAATWGFVAQPPASEGQDSDASTGATAVVPTPPELATPVAISTAGQSSPFRTPTLSTRPGGWQDNRGSTTWPVEGGYRLTAREPGRFVAARAPVAELPADVVVRASFRKVGGPSGGGYGLILRDDGVGPRDGLNQGGQYYVLEVGDNGEVGIWRRDEDHWVDLVPWTPADAVRPGIARNDLEARAAGGRLTLRVNNVDVATATDTTLMEGGVGVFVGGDGNDVVLERFAVELVE